MTDTLILFKPLADFGEALKKECPKNDCTSYLYTYEQYCAIYADYKRIKETITDLSEAAATDKTAKCPLYYTPETDGLSQSWDRGGAVFCNPPYGREIGKWVQKAFEEARGGIRLFYLSQRGRIRHIFTITFTGKRKSASCAGGYGSRTTTGTPPIPRPSLQW